MVTHPSQCLVASSGEPQALSLRDLTDRQLLERFAARQEKAAFEVLVRRHGPLVLRVCQRVLQDHHDAEDAFQATFIVLARKAAMIANADLLAGWLHGVAYRVAVRARRRTQRRHAREKQVDQGVLARGESPASANGCDLRTLLDEELDRLPEVYRLPLILCCLQGRSNTEAATQLGWPCGTVKGRLSRARDLLRGRLARRGLVVSAATLGIVLTPPMASAAVPAVLVAATLTGGTAALASVSQGAAAGGLLAQPLAWVVNTASKGLGAVKLNLATTALATAVVIGGGVLLLADKQPSASAAGHAGGTSTVVVSPTGKFVASGGWDGLVKLWNPVTGQELATLPNNYSREVWALAISPDGQTVASGKKLGIYLFDVATGRQKKYLQTPFPYCLAYSPDGKLLAAGRADGIVQLLDAETLQERAILRYDLYPGWLVRVAFSPDGKTVAAVGASGRGFLWEVATSAMRANFSASYGLQTSFAFAPDGKSLITATPAGLQVFDVATGRETGAWAKDVAPLASVAWAPDGKTIATADPQGTVTLWDVTNRQARESFKACPDGHCCMVFSPDSKTLLTWNQIANWGKSPANRDETIKVWKVERKPK